jgi:hypothetical protein
MGIVTMGVPQEIVLGLAKAAGADTFIETGTFQGGTTRWAARHFRQVHTIERSEALFRQHSPELAALPGVTPHLGDSREILPRIVAGLGPERAVYWLDGHWCCTPGGETAGATDQCPLLDELACLAGRPSDIILIDDARYFLSSPPPPNTVADWPTIAEICEAAPRGATRPFVQIYDDVIFLIPDEPALRACSIAYSQQHFDRFWNDFGAVRRGEWTKAKPPAPSLARRVLRKLGMG